MIITDYYKFTKLPNQNSKLRIDCVASSGSYPQLEALRAKREIRKTEKRDGCKIGNLSLFIGDNTYTKAGTDRKADLALSKTFHISSIYCPEPELPYWYGDFKGTADALLFIQNAKFVDGRIQAGAVIECFVCRGQRNNRASLYNLLADGELDDEIEAIRKASNPEGEQPEPQLNL